MLEDDVLGNLYKKFPVTIEKGLGSHVWDIDGNEYIDCMGAYGVAIIGYQNQRVNDAIIKHEKISLKHYNMFVQKNFQTSILEIVELKQSRQL